MPTSASPDPEVRVLHDSIVANQQANAEDLATVRSLLERLDKFDADFFDTIDNAPMGIHWVDADRRIIFANKTILTVLGYHLSEFLGKPCESLYENYGAILDYDARNIDPIAPPSLTTIMFKSDGTRIVGRMIANTRYYRGEFRNIRRFTKFVGI